MQNVSATYVVLCQLRTKLLTSLPLLQSESWLAEEADLLQLQREHVKSREVHLEEREKKYLEVVAQLDRDVSGSAVRGGRGGEIATVLMSA